MGRHPTRDPPVTLSTHPARSKSRPGSLGSGEESRARVLPFDRLADGPKVKVKEK